MLHRPPRPLKRIATPPGRRALPVHKILAGAGENIVNMSVR